MTRYLLGELPEADQQRVEERLLSDDAFYEELEIVENELVDKYARNALTDDEQALFRERFLLAPERRRKLAFAIALNRESAAHAAARADNVTLLTPAASPRKNRFFTSAYFKLAAAVVITIGIGLSVWRLMPERPSTVARGMAALNDAYKGRRLIEARVSGIGHAPLRRLRGDDRSGVDTTSRDRAARLLLDAVHEEPASSSHHALGRFYLVEGKLGEAQEQFEKALEKDGDNAQLHSDLGAVLLELGMTERTSDPGKSYQHLGGSLEHLNRALELNGSLPEALFNRALVYQHMLLTPQAKEGWRKYLELDSGSPWADEARRHLRLLEEQEGRASQEKEHLYRAFLDAFNAGDADAAWDSFRRARSRAGNHIVEQLLDEHLDMAMSGRDAEAAERLRRLSFAGEIEARRAGDRYTSDLAAIYARAGQTARGDLAQVRRLMRRANELYNKSEFESAAALYAEAARRFERAGDTCGGLLAESWVGYSELRIPAVEQSRRRFQSLAVVYERKGYRSLLAQSLHAISDAETSVNELSKALDYAGRAMKIAEQIQDDTTRLRCLQLFVSMHLRFGNYLESLRYGFDAIALAQKQPFDPKLVWPFFQEAALDFYWLGLSAAALELEREALRLAVESRWPVIIARSYARLAIIHERRGEYDEAIRSGLRAVAEGDGIEGELSRLNIQSQALLRLGHVYRQFGDHNRALACYDDALRMFDRLGLDIYGFEVHKGKFQAHAALGDNASAGDEMSRALELFEQFRTKIREERNRNHFFDAGQDVYDLAIDFAFAGQGDAARAFNLAEESRARSLLDLLDAAPEVIDAGPGPDIRHRLVRRPLQLEELRERLPDRVQLVEYSLLKDKLLIWVVTRDGIEARTVAVASEDIRSKVKAYVDGMAEGNYGADAARRAEELYALLIRPVESLLSEENLLCVIPDKELARLPFAALVSPETGKFFIERHRFVVAPSASIFVNSTDAALQKKATPGGEQLLSVGNPSFARAANRDLPDLPSAGREAEQVAAFYGAVPLIGTRAKEEKVRDEMLRADVVHLASHYVVDEQSQMLSRLLLADEPNRPAGRNAFDGVLHAYEVYAMRLPRTRLVVLSACRTGIEQAYQGEGAVGIARSFLSAGVPLVVASLWPVETETTAELMVKFHRYRKLGGLPSAEALRSAQLEMINASDHDGRQPHTWASFVTFGGYAEF